MDPIGIEKHILKLQKLKSCNNMDDIGLRQLVISWGSLASSYLSLLVIDLHIRRLSHPFLCSSLGPTMAELQPAMPATEQ